MSNFLLVIYIDHGGSWFEPTIRTGQEKILADTQGVSIYVTYYLPYIVLTLRAA